MWDLESSTGETEEKKGHFYPSRHARRRCAWLRTHVSTDVALKESSHQLVGGLLEDCDHGLIERVSVLVQPAHDIVRHLEQNEMNHNSETTFTLIYPNESY